jgi:tRNA threonylcarbamoyladenosine biosynthesis protein TsaE
MKIKVCGASSDFKRVAEYVMLKVAEGRNVVLLYGNLGAGKTTLVKQLVSAMGGDIHSVDSPTFSIVNEYLVSSNTIYHFDLYRLDTPEEIEDIGFWDYVDSGNLCFIEWPQKIAEFLPTEQVLSIEIALSSSQCREYYFY